MWKCARVERGTIFYKFFLTIQFVIFNPWKVPWNWIEITLRDGCSVNLLHISRIFPKSTYATLLKSHFGMGILLLICCIFSENLFLRTPMKGYFCNLEWLINLSCQSNYYNSWTGSKCIIVGIKAKGRISKRVRIRYVCVSQGVRNVWFSENLACFAFLKFGVFYLITVVLLNSFYYFYFRREHLTFCGNFVSNFLKILWENIFLTVLEGKTRMGGIKISRGEGYLLEF